jgi:hypothetical protein
VTECAACDNGHEPEVFNGNPTAVGSAGGLPSAAQGGAMTPRTFAPAASWTHKLESEQKQEHDFSNVLSEFGYAVLRQDLMMMKFCECELKRMFREKKPTKRRRR